MATLPDETQKDQPATVVRLDLEQLASMHGDLNAIRRTPDETREQQADQAEPPAAGKSESRDHRRRNPEWDKSVHGDAIRVGRIRSPNWDALMPRTRTSGPNDDRRL